MANIHTAITGIMGEVGAISKTKKNAQQGFMYRGVDDLMNALQPLLCKHKVFIVPEIIDQKREERQTKGGSNLIYSVCTIKYSFYADDGSSVSAIVVGEGMDSGDKASNKAMAVAFKYACFQVFCIPTEEMNDPDSETPPPNIPAPSAPSAPSTPIICPRCNTAVKGVKDAAGTIYTAAQIFSAYGMCAKCYTYSAAAKNG